MTSLARIRPSLRRAAFVAALGALMVPASAGAAVTADASATKRVKLPVVTRVAPLRVKIGQRLTIRGRNFRRGRSRNTVVFKRAGGKAVFVKAGLGTTKLLRLTVPAKLKAEFVTQGTTLLPTRFRIRVLAKKFGKRFTRASRSPVISLATLTPPPGYVASPPSGDCDGDGTKNGVDADDDNDGLTDVVEKSLNLNPCKGDTDEDGVEDRYEFDCDRNGVLNRDEGDDDKDLLSDSLEGQIKTDPCLSDTDGDGVEDGYEYRSARDLNDDEHQQPNTYLPYPGKRPYPNPLWKDENVDYDGDSLTLSEEQRLWRFSYATTRTDPRSLEALSYSDGEQYTRSRRIESGHDAGRRVPTLAARTYDKRQQFIDWSGPAGYRQVELLDGAPWYAHATERNPYGLFDVDRQGGEEDAELYYNDTDGNGFLSDDERDEDADGLTNYQESHGWMLPGHWASCYEEVPYPIEYAGTDMADADSDGDTVRDGADDQDHDDVPNLHELSRIRASSGLDDTNGSECHVSDALATLPTKTNHPDAYGRVNPFNPCLPSRYSRTCARYNVGAAPFDDSVNWFSLQ
jgi:hypothetical protein